MVMRTHLSVTLYVQYIAYLVSSIELICCSIIVFFYLFYFLKKKVTQVRFPNTAALSFQIIWKIRIISCYGMFDIKTFRTKCVDMCTYVLCPWFLSCPKVSERLWRPCSLLFKGTAVLSQGYSSLRNTGFIPLLSYIHAPSCRGQGSF